eukprot:6183605-Pleurochrysis_carterae.AAC.3
MLWVSEQIETWSPHVDLAASRTGHALTCDCAADPVILVPAGHLISKPAKNTQRLRSRKLGELASGWQGLKSGLAYSGAQLGQLA